MMLKDLVVNIVDGGYIPLQENDIYPPYLYFTSKVLSLRTGKRKIVNGACKGYISKKKVKLFYFEYSHKKYACRVYPMNGGSRSETYFVPDRSIVLVD